MRKSSKKNLQSFDKYKYYLDSVQSPEEDVKFFQKVYKELNKTSPKILCENFCGTFAVSCEWTKLNQKYKAFAVDINEEPLDYGRKNHISLLSHDQRKRLSIKKADVLDLTSLKSDMVIALNFSYFIFKERLTLKRYFENSFKQLKRNGLFILDAFGGPDCESPNEEETVHKNFSYFWDQDSFNPITNFAFFHIHFKRKGERKRKNVFSYDWRMWSIPEIRDLMTEVGFKKTYIYWEGVDSKGEGTGEYFRSEEGDTSTTWVAYIIGKK